MALAKTTKIDLIALKKNRDEIMELLQNLGFVQTNDYQEKELKKENLFEKISEYDYKIAGLKFCLDFLGGYDQTKKTLAQKFNPLIDITLSEAESIFKEFDYIGKIKEIQEIERGINEASSTIDKLKNEEIHILPWINLNFPFQKTTDSKYGLKPLIISSTSFDNFVSAISSDFPQSEIERINTEKNEIYAILYYRLDQEPALNELLNQFSIKTAELTDSDKLISERMSEIGHETNFAQSRLDKLKNEATALAAHQKELKISYDYLSWQREKIINLSKTGNSEFTFSLNGWIDESKITILENHLKEITKTYIIDILPIDPDENIPVIFNNTWAAPFEAVTKVYGAPLSHEPDPTPFLAPFFIVFFALCLTDAGYGIILALVSFLALKILKPSKESAKMFKVLMYGGIVTFFAGALVGGWFGIVIDDIKIDWLRNLLVGIRLIDPVKNPLTMLVFSLILGVIQILSGLMVGMYWKIRNKNYIDAILDEGVWLYFLSVIILWAISKLGYISLPSATYFIYSGVLALILTQGRKNKNPIMKIVGGITSLYGLISYVSDVLSYSRLLALGLATGIIAMVVNLIAGLVIDMVPIFGYVIAVFILIGGHIFNLGINALGSFIHSSRLQFVEFFPKFMEGGGQVFDPFQKVSKYLKITNNK